MHIDSLTLVDPSFDSGNTIVTGGPNEKPRPVHAGGDGGPGLLSMATGTKLGGWMHQSHLNQPTDVVLVPPPELNSYISLLDEVVVCQHYRSYMS